MVTATGAYSCVRADFGLKHEPRFKVSFKYTFEATKQAKCTSEGIYVTAENGQNHGGLRGLAKYSVHSTATALTKLFHHFLFVFDTHH